MRGVLLAAFLLVLAALAIVGRGPGERRAFAAAPATRAPAAAPALADLARGQPLGAGNWPLRPLPSAEPRAPRRSAGVVAGVCVVGFLLMSRTKPLAFGQEDATSALKGVRIASCSVSGASSEDLEDDALDKLIEEVAFPAESKRGGLEDDALDKLIEEEMRAAFAGLEESFADGDDEKAIELIQSQGKTVLGNVLSRLEDEGQLLSAQLSTRIETLAKEEETKLLERHVESMNTLMTANARARDDLRSEIENLEKLSKEYDELMANKLGGGVSRQGLASIGAALVGLSGGGAALNEGLKMAVGAGGDVQTLAVNLVLGAVGVAVYLQKKQSR